MRSPGPRPSTGRNWTLGDPPPSCPPSYPLEMPRPHALQRGDHRQRGSIRRHTFPGQGIQQPVAVGADLDDVGIALGTGLGQAHLLDAAAMALMPLRLGQGTQSVGSSYGNRIQRRAQRLGQQLDPVQVEP